MYPLKSHNLQIARNDFFLNSMGRCCTHASAFDVLAEK